MSDEMPQTRRDVLQAIAAGGATAGLAGCSAGGGSQGGGSGGQTTTETDNSFANYPVAEDSVTFGFTVPQSGPSGADGNEQRRGFELAVDHLNEGGGWVDSGTWGTLTGDGVLGRTVEAVFADTESTPATARNEGQRLIEQENAVMLAGGGSTGTARELMPLCQSRGVVHMLGFAPGTTVTGEDCARYGFQEMYNARMATNALAPVLDAEFETGTSFYQLHADSDYGFTQANTFARTMLRGPSWTKLGTSQTRVGTENFEPVLEEARDAGPDVVVLSYLGTDGGNAVRQAREVLPPDVRIVAPILSRSMAQFAGPAIENVLGTIVWDQSIDTPLSNAFTEAFTQTYDQAPSDQAQLAYGQTIQFAAAVERARTFKPDEVVRALEDNEYGMGIGSETLRKCDHQAIRPVPIVRGLSETLQSEYKRYESVDITRDVAYACEDDPANNCREMGPYVPGSES